MKNLKFTIYLLVLGVLLSCENADKRVDFDNDFAYKPQYGFDFDEYGIEDNGIYKLGYINSPVSLLIVPPHIVSYNSNQDFIITQSRYNKKDIKKHLEIALWFSQESILKDSIKFIPKITSAFLDKNLYNLKKPNLDSILTTHPYFRNLEKYDDAYYIILQKKNIIIGPMSKSEFNQRLDSLGIVMKLIEVNNHNREESQSIF